MVYRASVKEEIAIPIDGKIERAGTRVVGEWEMRVHSVTGEERSADGKATGGARELSLAPRRYGSYLLGIVRHRREGQERVMVSD